MSLLDSLIASSRQHGEDMRAAYDTLIRECREAIGEPIEARVVGSREFRDRIQPSLPYDDKL